MNTCVGVAFAIKHILMSEENVKDPTEHLDEQSRVRREKLEKLRSGGKDYPHFIQSSHSGGDIFAQWGEEKDAEKLKAAGNISVGGRCSFIRAFGKAGFVKLLSRGHNVQLYVAKDSVSPEEFEMYQNLDLGDQAWAEGFLFRTKNGRTEFALQQVCNHR